ncbi:hypothetical protein NM208_g3399 [Fusarium decemcellulare]|uniref:Uncharacterized protein n=2 Tax=Fusarium decemcellulare TaxID=57161 RepID=A0ACC1SLR0_9HYPO|nr:hypothetical protein NM208_g4175 [Fusarium decemcellulare]KAJ3543775.1 hypothetical protein NM208_g3399 [Fusarium decemcellulare]
MPETNGLKTDEVRVKVQWGSSSARDLLYLQSGWLARTPKPFGRNFAGIVVARGIHVKHVNMDDKVFGCTFESVERDPLQNGAGFLTIQQECVAKIPSNITPQAAVTIPSSFLSAFHAINAGLKLPVPWPNKLPGQNPHAQSLQLVWGAGGTVGQHIIQLLRHFGFNNRFAVSAKKHHEHLKSIGATKVFDQADPELPRALFEATMDLNHGSCPPGRFIIDLLASQRDSITHIATLAYPGARVAVSVPIIGDLNPSTGDRTLYLDPILAANWRPGVLANAFRPELYNQRQVLGQGLQAQLMPELIAKCVVTSVRFKEIRGATLEERVQKAMNRAREEGIEGGSFVWRVSEN